MTVWQAIMERAHFEQRMAERKRRRIERDGPHYRAWDTRRAGNAGR